MILADENIDSRIINILRDQKIKVYSILEEFPGITDFEIIQLARRTGFILLTEDKDFGEWVFSHKEKEISVIFLRYKTSDLDILSKSLVKLLKTNPDELISHFTTVTINKIRKRKI